MKRSLPCTVVWWVTRPHFDVHIISSLTIANWQSPDLQSMEQIRRVMRPTDVPDTGLLCDLLWSDPDKDITGWSENDRGVSFTFGPDVVSRFLQKHDMDLICRAHQVVEDGYEFFAKRQLVTLFSAPNYCGEVSLFICVCKRETDDSLIMLVRWWVWMIPSSALSRWVYLGFECVGKYWLQILKPAEKKAPKYGYGAAGGRRKSSPVWCMWCTDDQRLLLHQGRTRRARHEWKCEMRERCRDRTVCAINPKFKRSFLVFTCLLPRFPSPLFPLLSFALVISFSSLARSHCLSIHVWVSVHTVVRPKLFTKSALHSIISSDLALKVTLNINNGNLSLFTCPNLRHDGKFSSHHRIEY